MELLPFLALDVWKRHRVQPRSIHTRDIEIDMMSTIRQNVDIFLRQPFHSIVVSGTGSADDDWRYPATGRRVALMMQDLSTDGFASFG